VARGVLLELRAIHFVKNQTGLEGYPLVPFTTFNVAQRPHLNTASSVRDRQDGCIFKQKVK
jgi:hypothetical protein